MLYLSDCAASYEGSSAARSSMASSGLAAIHRTPSLCSRLSKLKSLRPRVARLISIWHGWSGTDGSCDSAGLVFFFARLVFHIRAREWKGLLRSLLRSCRSVSRCTKLMIQGLQQQVTVACEKRRIGMRRINGSFAPETLVSFAACIAVTLDACIFAIVTSCLLCFHIRVQTP